MKKGVIILVCLVFLFGLGGVVSAEIINTCSSPGQTIMKLYSPTNSHGALWNESTGATQIIPTIGSKTSVQDSTDASCVYDAGSRSVLSGHEIVAENPIHVPGDDCNTFSYLNLGVDTDVISKSAVYSSGDHGCVYSCPVNYGLRSVVSENPGTSDCNYYKCIYIGAGGAVYYSLPWVSATSPPASGAPWYSTDDFGCVYKCPTGYALQYFVAEVPSGVGDCNSFTCQKVNLFESSGAFNYGICYDDVFGVQGDGNRVCGTNKILRLFDVTNAHAEVPTGTTAEYDTPVCYGDLTCTVKDKTCGANEKMVVALFSDTNSHITDPNYIPDGMVSWWRFDDGTAKDWVGDNDGTLIDGAQITSEVSEIIIGSSLKLDGVNDYVNIPDDDSLDLVSAVTMEAWFYPESYPDLTAPDPIHPIIAKWDSENDERSYYISIGHQGQGINNKLSFGISSNGAMPDNLNQGSFFQGNAVISLNQWHHVVAIYDGSNMKLYLDGEPDGAISYSLGVYNSPTDLRIGGAYRWGATSSPVYLGSESFFDGQIDEVAIYNRALTLEEVQHRYNMGMYEKKICCSSDLGSQVWWENMDGEVITEACLGDNVRMVQSYSSSGDFEIFENDPSDNDTIRDGADNISGVVDRGNLVGVWRITPEDFNKGVDGDELLDGHIEAFFKVNGLGSGYLNISDEYCDEDMVVTLMSPDCGEDFTMGDISKIEINASDPNDLITGNVSVDGYVMDFTNGGVTFNYEWERSGNLQIELFARNSRGYIMRKITSVMVVDPKKTADYVAACIDKPADFSDIRSRNVEFLANSSRGLRCVGNGGCTPIGVSGLWFSWRFSDGLINFNHDGDNVLSYKFFKNFATAGHNWAILDVEIRDS